MSEAEATGVELAPERVAELLADGAQMVDVRRPYEFDAGRVPGARNIEMNELSATAESIPKDRPVVFCCRSGDRSGMAAEAFRGSGWEAYNMAGGITAWAQERRPLEPEDGEVRAPLPAS